MRAQVVDLLAAAPEHERIAALEPHDVLAALRVLDEQLVDLFLRGAAAADELADVEARGVAAREIQDFGGHEPVVHDDIGFLQRAQALQRHQTGIAGTGADQHDVSGGQGIGILERLARERLRPARCDRRATRRRRDRSASTTGICGARRCRRTWRLTATRQRSANAAKRPERAIQQGLEPLADQAREHGRGAAGGNRNLHGRAVDDGGHDEAGQLAIVDDVAGNARGIGGGGDGGIHGAIVRGGDDEPGAVDVAGGELARVMRDRAARQRGGELVTQPGRDDGDRRARRRLNK